MRERDFIDLPYGFLFDAEVRPRNMKELWEQERMYQSVIDSFGSPSDIEVLSNNEGTEVYDHIGEICIWYKNSHTDKVEYKKIYTYKDLRHSDILPSKFGDVLIYLIIYYGKRYGKVINITYTQEGMFWTMIRCEGTEYKFKIVPIYLSDYNNTWEGSYNYRASKDMAVGYTSTRAGKFLY